MKFILGTKQYMSQVFTENGTVPVTVIATTPISVTQVKTKEKDGYDAVQAGFESKKKKTTRREFKPSKIGQKVEHKVGDALTIDAFKAGDVVEVSAVSKGKGFQGVVKRHGFHGGPRSHGLKHSEREPGSISGGLRTGPRKGKRMAGRMGSDRVTVKNLKVMHIDGANQLMAISGAIPGRRGTLVEIKGR